MILTNHEAEVVLKDAASEVVIVRGVYFMENWGTGLETLPAGFFFTTLTPLDNAIPMVSKQLQTRGEDFSKLTGHAADRNPGHRLHGRGRAPRHGHDSALQPPHLRAAWPAGLHVAGCAKGV